MEACKLTASREGRRIEFEVVPGQPVVLGRSRECTVMLQDPEVSRQHCRIEAANGRVQVIDLDSSHGIVYRGERVQVVEIELGDGFHLGHTFVRFDAILHDRRAAPAPDAAVASASTIPLPLNPALHATAVPGVSMDATAASVPRPAVDATAASAPADELPPGTRLGGFVVDRTIGRSDRCTVHEARQTSLQRRVALKVLRVAEGLAGADERATFQADVAATAALHEGVLVPVFESGQEGDLCFAALEWVEGTPLSQFLVGTRQMHWRELLPVLVDVAQALHRLHELGHVHGAVKPSNVFATPGGGGRLADLRAGTTLRPRETTAYSAPELLRNQPLDAHSDLYSLGCVAYAALTGRPPYWGSPKQILDEQRTRRPADLTAVDPTMPRALDALVCGQLLALDPADRPASAAATREALSAMIGPTGAVAAPPVVAPRPVRPEPPIAAPPRDSAEDIERVAPARRAPSAAKSFGARLAADALIFGMVTGVLLALLVLLKIAGAFDLYEFFRVSAR